MMTTQCNYLENGQIEIDMLSISGKPHFVINAIVGKATRNPNKIGVEYIFLNEFNSNFSLEEKYSAIISNKDKIHSDIPQIVTKEALNIFEEGDILLIKPDGLVLQVYQESSLHNSLLITERCNNFCLMCSQPPKKENDYKNLFIINSKIIKLLPKNIEQIGVTGGEPTIAGKYFLDTLKLINDEIPNTSIHVLTNGRQFKDIEFLQSISNLDINESLIFGIPLYGDIEDLHDYIVQAKGAFNETIEGIYNLARYKIKIEIRIVLVKPLIKRLVRICEFIYKNMPFVDHIALMGLEHTGFTKINFQSISIDPKDYSDELRDSVKLLDSHFMNVSIFNIPLCLIDDEIRKFSIRSISDWKQTYIAECEMCSVKEKCCGVFTTSGSNISKNIKSITADVLC